MDHYLIYGWSNDWKDDCDPAPWFNITIYKLAFPTSSDPFFDFLSQPKICVPKDATQIEIYAKPDEITRVWLAIEKLLRMNKYNVCLILPEDMKEHIPVCFKPQINRGLRINFTPEKKSFYQSPFFKNLKDYDLDDRNVVKVPLSQKLYSWPNPVTRLQFENNLECHWHELFLSKDEEDKSINMAVINIGNLTDEPVLFWHQERNIEDFKHYIKRIAPMYDLLFTGIKVDLPNVKNVPGYMATWVDELPVKKDFSVSFLLSKFKTRIKNSLYDNRIKIFKKLKNNSFVKTRFYVSKRMINKYPKELHPYVLPTDSKKWIFESMFNLSIENIQQENYFTEKLLGCFETLTVPIYWGCPNITDYFDPKGMIIVSSIEEIEEKIKALTPELYNAMLPFVKLNKQKAQHFLGLKENYIKDFFEQFK